MPDTLSSVSDARAKRLTIIDDDLMSREVLTLLATESGFTVDSFESGETALEAPVDTAETMPDVFLIDMQMPGIAGDSLAALLRLACPRAKLLAMSGTAVPESRRTKFDGFLLKPFTMEALAETIDSLPPTQTAALTVPASPLNMEIFTALGKGMSAEQVRQLYTMCLDDADKRIGTLRQAAAARDDDAWRRAAHSIKGGCGMVGASELAAMATAMEEQGLPPVGNMITLDEFLNASSRLRRILDAQPI